MSTKVDKLNLDIEEFNELLQQAKRQRSKDVLSLEIRKMQTELWKLMEESKSTDDNNTPISTNGVANAPQRCYDVKLNNYGWDQTNSAMKLYVTLKNVHRLPKEALVCNFTENSVDLQVLGLDNKNYSLTINNLCEEIDADNSSVKTKTDMVVVSMAKKVPKHWSHVTTIERKIKEQKTALYSDGDKDGDTSFMNLMRNIYQDGDDEIKKMIAKTITETREQKAAGMSDY